MRRFKATLVACALAAVTALSVVAEECVALRPGTVEVVLPAKPFPAERFAAQEMTNFLSRVLGAPVPIVENGRAACPHASAACAVRPPYRAVRILLGRAAGFDVSAFERDAFRTKVERSAKGAATIRIAGRDGNADLFRYVWKYGQPTCHERATLFGVYAFLEDFAGVRFYFPGELGTVANRRNEVKVPVQDKVVAPWFPVRSVYSWKDGEWYEPIPEGWHKESGKALNCLRMRFETFRIPCCHGQNNFKIVQRFRDTHPEYCQLRKDGTRCLGLERLRDGYDHQWQLCQSSKVWDVFHDDIVADGRTGYVDVMPQDGYRPCECEACQASYRRNPDGSLPESYASELVWGQTAALGRRLLAEGRTDLTLTQMSYGAYKDVPNLDLPTNILVMVAVPGPWRVHDQKAHAASLERVRAWDRKTGRRVWLWTYPHKFFTTVLPGVPSFGPRAWGRFFKDAAPDIAGAFCESETDHWLFHYLNYYVFSRIAWNPETDVDAVIDEHNRLMFGAGAGEMAEFFDILEEKWVNGIAGRIIDTPVGPKTNSPCEYEIWTKLYSPAVVRKIEKLLSTAMAKAGKGTVEARRIELVARKLYGPLRKVARAYWSMCDADAERKRRAEMPDDGDAFRDAKWIPCSSLAKFDDKVFLSAPNSMMVTTGTNRTDHTGCFLGRTRLEPSTKYRISYFVKCDGIDPLCTEYNNGGVSVFIRQKKADGTNGREWEFPRNKNFLSGTTDWIPQVFEFDTDESWREHPKTLVYLQTRYAAGVARFDDVRLDKISK